MDFNTVYYCFVNVCKGRLNLHIFFKKGLEGIKGLTGVDAPTFKVTARN